MLRGSWQTTAWGVSAIIVALAGAVIALVDGNPDTNVDLTALYAAVAAGIGLMKARDNDKSSEDVGAK